MEAMCYESNKNFKNGPHQKQNLKKNKQKMVLYREEKREEGDRG